MRPGARIEREFIKVLISTCVLSAQAYLTCLQILQRTVAFPNFRDPGEGGGQEALVGEGLEPAERSAQPGGHSTQTNRGQHARG